MASPTWYIERIPAAGGASDTRTISAWGIDSMTITEQSWATGGADIVVPSDTAGTTAPAWADRDHLVVWEGNPVAGGTRRAHLWVLIPGMSAAPEAESHGYRLVGPWWWLESTQFFYPLHVVDITTDPETHAATGCTWEMRHGTDVVWTSWADQSTGTVKGQLHRALWCAIDNDAPIAIGAIDIAGYANVPTEQTGTCADVAARAARYSPRCSQWWDPSGDVPVFHASGYASRPAVTLALGPTSSGWSLAPRHDLRVDVVRIGYQWEDEIGPGAWYDIAGDDTLKDGPHTLRTLVDCPDEHFAAQASMHYGIAAQLFAALHSVPYDGAVSWLDRGDGVPVVHPGNALNLTGGVAALATMAAPIASVALTITSAAADVLTVSLGLPDTLGANDLFEMYNLALNLTSGAVGTDGGTSELVTTPVPGTVAELNGTDPFESNPSGTIATQVRGGTWQAQGFAPNPYVSAPALPLYRTATIGGSPVTITGGGVVTTVTHTGSSHVAADGTVTPGMTYSWAGGGSGGPDTAERLLTKGPGGINRQWYVFVRSATVRTMVGRACLSGDELPNPLPPASDDGHSSWSYGGDYTAAGEQTETLSSPDGESEAMARLLAASDWAYADETTTAIRTVPSSVTSGKYRELRIGTYAAGVYTPLAGMLRWQRYRIAIVLDHRTVDQTGTATGGWIAGGTVYSTPWITDMTGAGGCEWYTIAPQPGLETRIVSITPEIF